MRKNILSISIIILLFVSVCTTISCTQEPTTTADSTQETKNPYLTFSSPNFFRIIVNNHNPKTWDGTIMYSTDATNWQDWEWDTDSSIYSASNGKEEERYVLYIRGKGNSIITGPSDSYSGSYNSQWIIISDTSYAVECEGDIRTLLDWENPEEAEMGDYCFRRMFYSNDALITAPELPATELTEGCYKEMFGRCTHLISAPELPATELADYCYQTMFDSCFALTRTPKLPATELAEYCYSGMFKSCSSLVTVPYLPATTLASHCYENMFNGCSNLNFSESGEEDNCIKIGTGGTNPCYLMLYGTTGSFSSATSNNAYEGQRIYTSNQIIR